MLFSSMLYLRKLCLGKENVMNKIIYEYYYVVGYFYFHSHYNLIVEKETDKMYYGTAYGGKFAIKKAVLNSVTEIKDKKYGLVYRVQIDNATDECEAEKRAKQIIYNYIIDFAEKFKNNKGD